MVFNDMVVKQADSDVCINVSHEHCVHNMFYVLLFKLFRFPIVIDTLLFHPSELLRYIEACITQYYFPNKIQAIVQG